MSEHTPTPWIASNQYLYAGSPERSLPIASGQHDWATDRGGASHEEAVANAAFIVEAVNNHAGLVAALKDLLYANIRVSERPDSLVAMSIYSKAESNARVLLASLGEAK